MFSANFTVKMTVKKVSPDSIPLSNKVPEYDRTCQGSWTDKSHRFIRRKRKALWALQNVWSCDDQADGTRTFDVMMVFIAGSYEVRSTIASRPNAKRRALQCL